MTAGTRWRVGRVRRFTRNLIIPLDAAGCPLLVKYLRNRHEAEEEIRGHACLAPHYPVPALHRTVRVPGGRLLIYERLPTGRDQGLLLDLLNAPGEPTGELAAYMDELTSTYAEVIQRTARLAHPHEMIRKLYWDRAAPSGRLHTYYRDRDFPLAEGILDIPVSRLGTYTLNINGQLAHLDWASTLAWVHNHFAQPDRTWAAITQGDPTDVNLAHPLAWFDYDTAGLNSILGEFANFLWYTTHLGGWLVPTYNPDAFADHPATHARLPDNTPELRHAFTDPASRTLHITYSPRLSPARRAAASWYWHRLVQPLATTLWPGHDLADLLRPYLVMRILAVYNIADLRPNDRLILIARLAETMAPTFHPAAQLDLREAPWAAH